MIPSIERQEYEEFVLDAPDATIFAEPWWLDITAGPGRWRANSVKKGDSVIGAWPTVIKRTPFGPIHRGAPFTPRLGPIFGQSAVGAKRYSRIVDVIPKLVTRMGTFAHVSARCNPQFDYWTPLLWEGFAQTVNYSWRITECSPTFEGIRPQLRRNVVGSLKKAEKAGLSVREGTPEELVPMVEETLSSRGVAVPERALMDKLCSESLARRRGTILAAVDKNDQLRSIGLFVHDQRVTWYLMGATNRTFSDVGASCLVILSGIHEAARRGNTFDFEGSMVQSIEPVFRGFGGKPVPYSVVTCTRSRIIDAALICRKRRTN
jgi:hypothetical protein